MKAIGIILAGGNNDGRLGVLTDHRAAAALPMTRRNWPLLPPWACTAAACIRF